ncbi:uncharacterized protein LOC113364054 isoform X2 [Ctenocephalides felis]|uniref:uncharacterized protein LOC113364054 isoform X2 n=1 Tax=Ctenocephalides felis TaxID=7515 RepID=UPI000E6E5AFB|nr:uncharacterized protein LOC113364054 isoform X2 [Ctenocephalides felis]
MNRIVASLNGSVGTRGFDIGGQDKRNSPPICGQKASPVKCTRIVAPVPIDIRFTGTLKSDKKNITNDRSSRKHTIPGLNRATVKRRQSLDRLKNELQSLLDSNLQDEKNNETLVEEHGKGFIEDNIEIKETIEDTTPRTNTTNAITLSPHSKLVDKSNDNVAITASASKKSQQQDQGKILSYIRQQRLKRKVQLKQEKNEKMNMEQAKKQRLKELQDKTLKILAENIKHRKNDKKTRTTHSMVVPVPSTDNHVVGKNTIYMRGKLKSPKTSRAGTAVAENKKAVDAEGFFQNECLVENQVLKPIEKFPSSTNIVISEPHNIVKPVPLTPVKTKFKSNRADSRESLHNDRELMLNVDRELEVREREKKLMIKRITAVQACVRGFLQRTRYKKLLQERIPRQISKPPEVSIPASQPPPTSSPKPDVKEDVLPHYLRQGIIKPCPYNFITAVKRKINLAVTGSVPYCRREITGSLADVPDSISYDHVNRVADQSSGFSVGLRRSTSCDSRKLSSNLKSKCHCRHHECTSRRSTSADSNTCSRILSTRHNKDEESIKTEKSSGRNKSDQSEGIENALQRFEDKDKGIISSRNADNDKDKNSTDISENIKTTATTSTPNSKSHFKFDPSIKKLESPTSEAITSNLEYESTFTKFSSEPQSKPNDFNSCSKNDQEKSNQPLYNIKVENKLISDLKSLSELYTTFSAYVDAENSTSRDLSPIHSEKSKRSHFNLKNISEPTDVPSEKFIKSERFSRSKENKHSISEEVPGSSNNFKKSASVHVVSDLMKSETHSVTDEVKESNQNDVYSQNKSKDYSRVVSENLEIEIEDDSIRAFSDKISKKCRTHRSDTCSISEDLKSYEENLGHNNKISDPKISEHPNPSQMLHGNEFLNPGSWNTNGTCNLVYTQYSCEFENSKTKKVDNLKKPAHRLKIDQSKFTNTDSSIKNVQPKILDSGKAKKTPLIRDLSTDKVLSKNEDIKAVIKYIEDLKSLSKTLFESKDTQTSFKHNTNELYIPPLDLSRINSSRLKSSCSSFENIQNIQNSRTHMNAASESESSTSIFITKRNHHDDLVNLNNLDKMLHEEYLKVMRLKSMLKKKEQSLIDRTKDEITLLENRKRELKMSGNVNEIPSLKKKQRGLLLNLQQERYELDKMKKRYKQSYNERKQIIKNNRKLFGKFDAIRDNDINITKRNENCADEQLDFRKSDDFSAMLSKREKELQRRRSHVEALLLWSRRLDEREKEISEIESRLQLARNQKPRENIPNRSSRNLAEEFYNERPVIPNHNQKYLQEEDYSSINDASFVYRNQQFSQDRRLFDETKHQNFVLENIKHDEYKNNALDKSKGLLDTIVYERPKYFVDNIHEQRSTNVSQTSSKFYVDTTNRKAYLDLSAQKFGNENFRHIGSLQDKPNRVNNTVANKDIPNLQRKFGDNPNVIEAHDGPIYETIQQLKIEDEKLSKDAKSYNLDRSAMETVHVNSKISHFVQTGGENVAKPRTDKSVQTSKSKRVKGSDLNRLWKHITGSKKKLYSDSQVYKMSKRDLENFYEDAKKEAMMQFSENDDTVLSVFHNSLSDENYDQNVQTITYDSHGHQEQPKVFTNVEQILSGQNIVEKTLANFGRNDNIISEHIITKFDDLSKNRKKWSIDPDKKIFSDASSSKNNISTSQNLSKSMQSDRNLKEQQSTESVTEEIVYSTNFESESQVLTVESLNQIVTKIHDEIEFSNVASQSNKVTSENIDENSLNIVEDLIDMSDSKHLQPSDDNKASSSINDNIYIDSKNQEVSTKTASSKDYPQTLSKASSPSRVLTVIPESINGLSKSHNLSDESRRIVKSGESGTENLQLTHENALFENTSNNLVSEAVLNELNFQNLVSEKSQIESETLKISCSKERSESKTRSLISKVFPPSHSQVQSSATLSEIRENVVSKQQIDSKSSNIYTEDVSNSKNSQSGSDCEKRMFRASKIGNSMSDNSPTYSSNKGNLDNFEKESEKVISEHLNNEISKSRSSTSDHIPMSQSIKTDNFSKDSRKMVSKHGMAEDNLSSDNVTMPRTTDHDNFSKESGKVISEHLNNQISITRSSTTDHLPVSQDIQTDPDNFTKNKSGRTVSEQLESDSHLLSDNGITSRTNDCDDYSKESIKVISEQICASTSNKVSKTTSSNTDHLPESDNFSKKCFKMGLEKLVSSELNSNLESNASAESKCKNKESSILSNSMSGSISEQISLSQHVSKNKTNNSFSKNDQSDKSFGIKNSDVKIISVSSIDMRSKLDSQRSGKSLRETLKSYSPEKQKTSSRSEAVCDNLATATLCNQNEDYKNYSQKQQIVYYFTGQEMDSKSNPLNSKSPTKSESIQTSPEKQTSSSDNLANMPQEVTLQKLNDILLSDYANSVSSQYSISVDKVYEENEDYIKSQDSNGSILDTTITDHMMDENEEPMSNVYDSKESTNGDGTVGTCTLAKAKERSIDDDFVGKNSCGSPARSLRTDITFPNYEMLFLRDVTKKYARSLDDDLHKISKLTEEELELEIAQDLIIYKQLEAKYLTPCWNALNGVLDEKYENDLEKSLLKIDTGLKSLNNTFEKVPILDKLTDTSHNYPSDFDSNVYTSSESEKKSNQSSYCGTNEKIRSASSKPVEQPSMRKEIITESESDRHPSQSSSQRSPPRRIYQEDQFTEPNVKNVAKENKPTKELYSDQYTHEPEKLVRVFPRDLFTDTLLDQSYQSIIDAQNLSPRGKNHKPFTFNNVDHQNLSPRLPADNVHAEYVCARVKNLISLHLEPTIFETPSEDVKFSENSMNLEKALNESGGYQKIEDESGLNLLDDTTGVDNEVPEEIFWYEDENDGSFKENEYKGDATFDFGNKATSIGEISPPRKSFINDDENVSGNRSSEVRERVRQIMETRNSPCRTQVGHSDSHVGSPRLQDLWITTNENLTPSPGNSPPVSPVISQLSSEAEELRRKQLEIELEIKRLQQQSEIQLEFYVREIPNKPPPPYTPPLKTTTSQQPESNQVNTLVEEDSASCHSVAVSTTDIPQPLSRDQTEALVIENTRTLYNAFINGKISTTEYTSFSDSNINEKLVFDLCKEVIIDHFKYTTDVPIWLRGKTQQPHKNVYYNLEDLTQFVSKKVLQFMNFEPTFMGVNKRCSTRNAEGSMEVVMERADWKRKDCDYELLCKENVTNCIMNMLLTETADVVSESFRRKNLAAKKS